MLQFLQGVRKDVIMKVKASLDHTKLLPEDKKKPGKCL